VQLLLSVVQKQQHHVQFAAAEVDPYVPFLAHDTLPDSQKHLLPQAPPCSAGNLDQQAPWMWQQSSVRNTNGHSFDTYFPGCSLIFLRQLFLTCAFSQKSEKDKLFTFHTAQSKNQSKQQSILPL